MHEDNASGLLKEFSLLYVEDDESIRGQLVDFLRRRMGALHIATDGAAGLEIYRRFKPDIVVTDIMMPVMDGLKMAEKIKELSPSTPIVVTTAYNEAQFFLKAIDIGVDKFIIKPVNSEALGDILLQCARTMLVEVERRLSAAVFDNSSDAIVVSDHKNRIVSVNSAFCEITGYAREEVIGKDPRMLGSGRQSHEFYVEMWNSLREAGKWSGEIWNRRKSGELYSEWLSASTVKNDHGEITHYVGIFSDVTERKLAEERHRISEERLQLVLDATQDGLWDWDLRSGLAYLTPRYYEMTGYRPDQVIPDFKFYQRTVHPDDLPRVLEALDANMQGKASDCVFDYRMVTCSGETRWVAVRGRVVERDSGGMPLRIVGTVSDINERKHIETALRDAQESLEMRVLERTSQLRRLAVESTLAEERERQAIARDLHDNLGQILHVIKIKLDTLAKTEAKGDLRLRELNDLVADSSQIVRSLTSQLSPPALKNLGLGPALSWLAGEMEKTYGLNVAVYDDDSPKPLSKAQAAILFRAVRELLINIVKHAETDTAQLSITTGCEQLVITVADNGIGIVDVNLLESAEGRKGFGLASVRERIQFLGGTIEIQVNPGGGTAVIIQMPIEPSPNPEATT